MKEFVMFLSAAVSIFMPFQLFLCIIFGDVLQERHVIVSGSMS